MVKRLIVGALLCLFLTGCSSNGEIIITESDDEWSIDDRMLDLGNLSTTMDSTRSFVGAVNSGVYICDSFPEQAENPDNIEKHIYFLPYEDIESNREPEKIFKITAPYYSAYLDGENLIIQVPEEEIMQVMMLDTSNESTFLYKFQPSVFSPLKTSASHILSIRGDSLVLTQKDDNSETTVFEATYDSESNRAERLTGGIAVNEDYAFWGTESTNDKIYYLYIYDICKGEIFQKVEVEHPCLYGTYMNDKVLISQTDTEFIEQAGGIGSIVNGKYVEDSKIPYIDPAHYIRDDAVNDEGIYFASSEVGYFWNRKDNNISLHLLYQKDEGEELCSDISITEKGFRFILKKSGGYYIRTMEKK